MGRSWCPRTELNLFFQKIPMFIPWKSKDDTGDHFKATVWVLVTIPIPSFTAYTIDIYNILTPPKSELHCWKNEQV